MRKTWITLLLALLMLSASVLGAYAEGTIVIGEQQSTQSTLGGETELKIGQVEKVQGEYSIEFFSAGMGSDQWVCAGKHAVYLSSQENNAPIMRYEHKVGTTTPIWISFTYTNRSRESVNPLKHVKARLVFDDHYVFETIPMQVNPDQRNANGELGTPSTSAVDVEPLMAVEINFATHVPFIVRDSDKPLVLYLIINDTDVYAVDIRSNVHFWE